MKTSMTYKLLLGVIALTLSACGELEKAAKDLQDEVDDRTNGGDKKEQVLKYSDVYTKVLQGRCDTCHQGPRAPKGLSLGPNDYAAVLRQGSVNKQNPRNSKLYRDIVERRMPPTGPFLNEDLANVVLKWIEGGAK